MKLKLITAVSTNDHPGLHKLEHSLKLFGWDYYIIHDPNIAWSNWGAWPQVVEYCRQLKEQRYTHVIYTDGFDTLALGTQAEGEYALKAILGEDLNRIIFSAEKNYFPHEEPNGEVTPRYHELFSNERLGLTDRHRWRYANGGQWGGSIDRVIEWYENAPKELNNQYWANKYFSLHNDSRMLLDFECLLFQSVAFSYGHGGEDEFITLPLNTTWTPSGEPERNVEKKLFNNYTKTYPILAHGNGRSEFQFVYDILGL